MSLGICVQLILIFVLLDKYYTGAEIAPRDIKSTDSSADESFLETKLTETLDHSGRIVLSWELGEDKSIVTFELWAQTLGYVGFGISPNGGMAGADIFIAGVAPDGTPYFSDRFTSANEAPIIDSHQDWTLHEAKENETTTYLKFSRVVNTCDKDEDYPITKGTNKVIWAIGPSDELVKHFMADRGTRSISFLYQRPKLNTKGMETWIAGLHELAMPSDETTYWCSVHESFPLDTPKYVIGHEAYLDKHALKHVHHMGLYKCLIPNDDSYYNTMQSLIVTTKRFMGYLCSDGEKHSLVHKYCSMHLFLTYSKGDKAMALPNNVAFKVDKEETVAKKQYWFLETHLDNSEKSEGVILNYGLKVLYTNKPRQFDAAMMLIAYKTERILIPPNTRNFVYSGHCGPQCTEKLDPPGISILFVQLHAHKFARKLKLRHFRNDIELPWIAHDDKYDFNYQQYRMLDEERKVLPGDRLTIECEYDSTRNNGKIVMGGTSSSDEMCLGMIWYYPSNENLVGCSSKVEEKEFLAPFNITKYAVTKVLNTSRINIEEPANLRGNLEESLNSKFEWTDEFVDQLQRRKQFEDQVVSCESRTVGWTKGGVLNYPKNIIEFVPQESCA